MKKMTTWFRSILLGSAGGSSIADALLGTFLAAVLLTLLTGCVPDTVTVRSTQVEHMHLTTTLMTTEPEPVPPSIKEYAGVNPDKREEILFRHIGDSLSVIRTLNTKIDTLAREYADETKRLQKLDEALKAKDAR